MLCIKKKVTEFNTLDVQKCPQSCLLFVYGQVKESQHVWAMSEPQGGSLLAVPAKHDSSSGTRTGTVTVETE